MKKRLICLALLLALGAVFAAPAFADMGPKPSVHLDIRGLEGSTYYVTLLSDKERCGPWGRGHAFSGEEADRPGWEALAAYEDGAGYHFMGYLENCTQSHAFAWTYYPPEPFRVLIWVADTRQYLAGPVMERYAYDSYYTLTADPAAGALALQESYDFTWEAISLACRALLTVAVELALAWAVGWRDKAALRLVLGVNLLTQLGLNLALNLVNYQAGLLAFMAAFALFELLVFAAEGLVYRRRMPPHPATGKPRRVWLYALAANGLSYLVGYKLAQWIPGIF